MNLTVKAIREGELFSISWGEAKISNYPLPYRRKEGEVQLTPELSCVIGLHLESVISDAENNDKGNNITQHCDVHLDVDIKIKSKYPLHVFDTSSVAIKAAKNGVRQVMTANEERIWTVSWANHANNQYQDNQYEDGVHFFNFFNVLIDFDPSGIYVIKPGQRGVIQYMKKLLADSNEGDLTFLKII